MDDRTFPIPEALVRYIAIRDQQRADRVEGTLSAMTKREQSLVREAAVMGFVRGEIAGRVAATMGEPSKCPPDSAVLAEVIACCLAYADAYPTMTRLLRIAARRAAAAERDSTNGGTS